MAWSYRYQTTGRMDGGYKVHDTQHTEDKNLISVNRES